LDEAGGCPNEYSAGEDYKGGDKVAVAGNDHHMIVYGTQNPNDLRDCDDIV
jgi:hypothetical protein